MFVDNTNRENIDSFKKEKKKNQRKLMIIRRDDNWNSEWSENIIERQKNDNKCKLMKQNTLKLFLGANVPK